MTIEGVITPTLFTGTLSIDGVLLHTPAWDLPDLGDLWFPASVRGTDRTIAGRTGVLPYRRRATVTTRTLRMMVTGLCDQTGELYDFATGDFRRDHQLGLVTNLAYLRANVVDPTNAGDGTRTASLQPPDPDADPTTLPVHVLGMTPGVKVGPVQRVTIDLSFPSGAFPPEALAP